MNYKAHPRPRRSRTERILAFIHKTDDCWLWTGHRSREGYGRFTDTDNRPRNAHRVVYEILVGPIPPGQVLDHLCRVRHCVNPAHMEPVTNRDNILRGESPPAVNHAKTHCNNGHSLGGDNLYIAPNGSRKCRQCHGEAQRRYLDRISSAHP